MAAQVWLVRAGNEDAYEPETLKQGLVALGWKRVGDLTGHPTMGSVNAAVNAAYPEFSVRSRHEFAAQLYAFRSKMKHGDYVVLLRSNAPDLAIGVVTGEYAFRPDLPGPHVHPVRWEKPNISRSEVGTDLLTAPALSNVYKLNRDDAEQRVAAIVSPVHAVPPPTVSTPAAVPTTAMENLRRNLDYSNSLAQAGHHLQQLQVGLFEVSDVFRAAWVQSVAALDHWVHQEIRERMLDLATKPSSAWPAKFQAFPLPIELVDGVAVRSLTLGGAIDRHYEKEMGRVTFQGPQQIQEGFALVANVAHLWGRVATVLTEQSADEKKWTGPQVQERLKEIVFRRNKIAHEYDEDPQKAPTKREIDSATTNKAITFIGQLAEAVVAVLDSK